MFGPNKYFTTSVKINYSHRDKAFFDLYTEVKNAFISKFNLFDYDVLFIPGTATVGIESLMYSLHNPIEVVGAPGTFRNRWLQMSKNYNSLSDKKGVADRLFCLFETSNSTYQCMSECFVDAVSAFPYYDIPKNSLGFVTCCNKQLGSFVGLAIVGIRKDLWAKFKTADIMSYLNLSRYHQYDAMFQLPVTAPTYIFEHLLKVIEEFDLDKFRKRIDLVCDLIVSSLGADNFIGDLRGPCLTFKQNIIPKGICEKYDIYGYWAGREHYQIFTYNGELSEYRKFIDDMINYRKELNVYV